MEVKMTTPIAALNVEQLLELLDEKLKQSKKVEENKPKEKEYIKGIKGVRKLFSVSHAVAQQYKNTFLQPAVIQRGRTILVDKEMALVLFANKKNGVK